MSTPSPDRNALKEIWRERVEDAKLRLDFARNYMLEVRRDYPSSHLPEGDHHFAYKKALLAEDIALKEYDRVQHLYTELAMNGVIPDEAEWLKEHPMSPTGGEDPSLLT